LAPIKLPEEWAISPFTTLEVPAFMVRFSEFLMQKTRKSVAKRFKITGTGKVMRRSPNRRHLLSSKSVKQKRLSGNDKETSKGLSAIVRKALPHSNRT
jgi:large subunit ribosomal protein L35